MARNAHPEVTRTRILDAAQRLFMAKGYEHTSIQNIVDELGDLSKGAIYHHFGSKQERDYWAYFSGCGCYMEFLEFHPEETIGSYIDLVAM